MRLWCFKLWVFIAKTWDLVPLNLRLHVGSKTAATDAGKRGQMLPAAACSTEAGQVAWSST